ncbi:aspartate kinase [Gracilibacillus ureilyticus]|uniref:Aspartokinase n=1 Tax=Gracilibacillus ureilyticus TaxID=531814 RepID=A0A1H9L8L4_9BACI|nr:aspartate kinase [Gracilibacillus ureilyticus]SER07861.1 aspartate kinase [Gracilibacillus ureilyticus]
MKVLVQKFGGTSVRDEKIRQHAVDHVKDALNDGYKVIVVVSAMGRYPDPYATDSLLHLVGENTTKLSAKEKDLLLSCGETISSVVFSHELLSQNIESIAITGAQAGIITTSEFTNAQIKTMNIHHLSSLLNEYQVVVVAGFQGRNDQYEVTTIGRGGSDTSATALAAAIGAEYVDIFTDVNGIMTADPRLVSSARKLEQISYNEVCNLAYQGAKVIHPRAVEIAMQANIPIRVRSTREKDPGTLITSVEIEKHTNAVTDRLVTGIAYVDHLTQIKIDNKMESEQLHVSVFKAMAEAGISVDFINISPGSMMYTIFNKYEDKALNVLKKLDIEPMLKRNCAKISLVGAGMSGLPGATSTIVQTLSSHHIPIFQSADSHRTIWVLIKSEHLQTAINALHLAFQLDNNVSINEN